MNQKYTSGLKGWFGLPVWAIFNIWFSNLVFFGFCYAPGSVDPLSWEEVALPLSRSSSRSSSSESSGDGSPRLFRSSSVISGASSEDSSKSIQAESTETLSTHLQNTAAIMRGMLNDVPGQKNTGLNSLMDRIADDSTMGPFEKRRKYVELFQATLLPLVQQERAWTDAHPYLAEPNYESLRSAVMQHTSLILRQLLQSGDNDRKIAAIAFTEFVRKDILGRSNSRELSMRVYNDALQRSNGWLSAKRRETSVFVRLTRLAARAVGDAATNFVNRLKAIVKGEPLVGDPVEKQVRAAHEGSRITPGNRMEMFAVGGGPNSVLKDLDANFAESKKNSNKRPPTPPQTPRGRPSAQPNSPVGASKPSVWDNPNSPEHKLYTRLVARKVYPAADQDLDLEKHRATVAEFIKKTPPPEPLVKSINNSLATKAWNDKFNAWLSGNVSAIRVVETVQKTVKERKNPVASGAADGPQATILSSVDPDASLRAKVLGSDATAYNAKRKQTGAFWVARQGVLAKQADALNKPDIKDQLKVLQAGYDELAKKMSLDDDPSVFARNNKIAEMNGIIEGLNAEHQLQIPRVDITSPEKSLAQRELLDSGAFLTRVNQEQDLVDDVVELVSKTATDFGDKYGNVGNVKEEDLRLSLEAHENALKQQIAEVSAMQDGDVNNRYQLLRALTWQLEDLTRAKIDLVQNKKMPLEVVGLQEIGSPVQRQANALAELKDLADKLAKASSKLYPLPKTAEPDSVPQRAMEDLSHALNQNYPDYAKTLQDVQQAKISQAEATPSNSSPRRQSSTVGFAFSFPTKTGQGQESDTSKSRATSVSSLLGRGNNASLVNQAGLARQESQESLDLTELFEVDDEGFRRPSDASQAPSKDGSRRESRKSLGDDNGPGSLEALSFEGLHAKVNFSPEELKARRAIAEQLVGAMPEVADEGELVWTQKQLKHNLVESLVADSNIKTADLKSLPLTPGRWAAAMSGQVAAADSQEGQQRVRGVLQAVAQTQGFFAPGNTANDAAVAANCDLAMRKMFRQLQTITDPDYRMLAIDEVVSSLTKAQEALSGGDLNDAQVKAQAEDLYNSLTFRVGSLSVDDNNAVVSILKDRAKAAELQDMLERHWLPQVRAQQADLQLDLIARNLVTQQMAKSSAVPNVQIMASQIMVAKRAVFNHFMNDVDVRTPLQANPEGAMDQLNRCYNQMVYDRLKTSGVNDKDMPKGIQNDPEIKTAWKLVQTSVSGELKRDDVGKKAQDLDKAYRVRASWTQKYLQEKKLLAVGPGTNVGFDRHDPSMRLANYKANLVKQHKGVVGRDEQTAWVDGMARGHVDSAFDIRAGGMRSMGDLICAGQPEDLQPLMSDKAKQFISSQNLELASDDKQAFELMARDAFAHSPIVQRAYDAALQADLEKQANHLYRFASLRNALAGENVGAPFDLAEHPDIAKKMTVDKEVQSNKLSDLTQKALYEDLLAIARDEHGVVKPAWMVDEGVMKKVQAAAVKLGLNPDIQDSYQAVKTIATRLISSADAYKDFNWGQVDENTQKALVGALTEHYAARGRLEGVVAVKKPADAKTVFVDSQTLFNVAESNNLALRASIMDMTDVKAQHCADGELTRKVAAVRAVVAAKPEDRPALLVEHARDVLLNRTANLLTLALLKSDFTGHALDKPWNPTYKIMQDNVRKILEVQTGKDYHQLLAMHQDLSPRRSDLNAEHALQRFREQAGEKNYPGKINDLVKLAGSPNLLAELSKQRPQTPRAVTSVRSPTTSRPGSVNSARRPSASTTPRSSKLEGGTPSSTSTSLSRKPPVVPLLNLPKAELGVLNSGPLSSGGPSNLPIAESATGTSPKGAVKLVSPVAVNQSTRRDSIDKVEGSFTSRSVTPVGSARKANNSRPPSATSKP